MPYMLDTHQGANEFQSLCRMQHKNFCGHYIFYFQHFIVLCPK